MGVVKSSNFAKIDSALTLLSETKHSKPLKNQMQSLIKKNPFKPIKTHPKTGHMLKIDLGFHWCAHCCTGCTIAAIQSG